MFDSTIIPNFQKAHYYTVYWEVDEHTCGRLFCVPVVAWVALRDPKTGRIDLLPYNETDPDQDDIYVIYYPETDTWHSHCGDGEGIGKSSILHYFVERYQGAMISH